MRRFGMREGQSKTFKTPGRRGNLCWDRLRQRREASATLCSASL